MPFKFTRLSISDVILIESQIFQDDRGFFLENFKESIFKDYGINLKFVQDNFSYSLKGVLRGLHFQKPPKTQAKFVTALKGKIFDVAVDLRINSSTYGKWVSEILSEDNHRSLYVPEGFAHGFCVLSDDAYVLYKITQEYSSEHDSGIIWNDSKLNIPWPIDEPILSKKDQTLPMLKNLDSVFDFNDN